MLAFSSLDLTSPSRFPCFFATFFRATFSFSFSPPLILSPSSVVPRGGCLLATPFSASSTAVGEREEERGSCYFLLNSSLSHASLAFSSSVREKTKKFFKQPEDGGNGLSDPALMCIFFAAHKFGEKGLLAVAGGGLTSFISLPPGFISSPTYPTYRFLPSHTHIGYTHPLVFLQA